MKLVFKNIMEIIVVDKINEMMNDLDCCKCDQCQMDIASYVLNRLPPKYIVTTKGEIFSNLDLLGVQYTAVIITMIMEAAAVIKKNPRH